SRW
ncbi:tat (twin-arginine translocation) pathway signal sequence domain protein, partial [Vibrio parahaemolyticus AQ3810]